MTHIRVTSDNIIVAGKKRKKGDIIPVSVIGLGTAQHLVNVMRAEAVDPNKPSSPAETK